MAHIAVLAHHQKETEQPFRFVRRSEGQTLVRRALAYWVVKNAIARMLPPLPVPPPPCPREYRPSLEDKTSAYNAPAELPGLRFDDPVKKPVAPRMMFLSRTERTQQYEL